MTKALDPFEEYLRKKKVEMLESKFREQATKTDDEGEAEEDGAPVNEDPEVEARLQEEVDEFFQAGQSAGAELFQQVGSDISDEKVEEIRDALEEVFEEDAPAPMTEAEDQAFVSFFKQVEDSYAPPSELPPEHIPPSPAVEDISTTAAEVSAGEEQGPDTDTGLEHVEPLINLTEILAPPKDDDELRQRVEVLSRLVAKLLERAKLPEHELIEVLIKSGVEF